MRALVLTAALLSVSSVRAQEANPTPTWVRVAGGPGDAVVTALDATDSYYNEPQFVAAVGTFENVLSFGAGGSPLVAPEGSAAAFVSVFSTSWQSPGELRWQRRLACAGGCAVAATAVGVRRYDWGTPLVGGEVAVVGWADGTLTVDGGEAPDVTLGHDGGRDGFVVLYTRDGRLVWAERMGGAGDVRPAGVAFAFDSDPTPRILVSGGFSGDVTWAAEAGGADGAASAGGTDGFVASYGLNGGFRDALVVGSASDESLAGIGSYFETWVAGTFRDTLVVGGDTLASRGGTDVLALHLSETMALERTVHTGGPEDDTGQTITTGDPYWQPLLSGTFSGTLESGGITVSSLGGTDVFHLQIPEAGPWLPELWGHGSTADDTLAAVAPGAGFYGDVHGPFPVAVGWTNGRMRLETWSGGTDLPTLGGVDGFAIGSRYGYDPRGTQVGGPATDRVLGATAAVGYPGLSIVIGGSFQQSLRLGSLVLPGQAPADDDAFVAFYPAGLLTPFYIADEPAPSSASALRVAPNPSRGDAVARLAVEAPSARVTVRVHDALGRIVAVLHDGPLGAGEAAFALPASLPAGRYLVRATGGATASVPLTVVR